MLTPLPDNEFENTNGKEHKTLKEKRKQLNTNEIIERKTTGNIWLEEKQENSKKDHAKSVATQKRKPITVIIESLGKFAGCALHIIE